MLNSDGVSTAMKFRSIINNHLDKKDDSDSDGAESIVSDSNDVIVEEVKEEASAESQTDNYDWKQREMLRRSRISGIIGSIKL